MKRTLLLILFLLASIVAKAQISREKQIEDDGFVWYLVIDERDEDEDYYGAEDKNGKTIISYKKKYTDIDYDNGFFIVENAKDYEGVIDKKGKVIIPLSRHYECITFDPDTKQFWAQTEKEEVYCDISGKVVKQKAYSSTTKKASSSKKKTSGYTSAYKKAISTETDATATANTRTTTTSTTTSTVSKTNTATSEQQIARDKQAESDGFVWNRIHYNGDYSTYGAEDSYGNTIIPLSKGYSNVYYYNGYFHIEKNKCYGACDKYGQEIISTDRGYERIVAHGDWFGIKRNGKEGACDLTGKEVVAPNYSDLINVDGVYKYKDAYGNWQNVTGSSYASSTVSSSRTTASSTSSAASTSSSTTSSTYTGSTSSDNGRLLFSGQYTRTGVFADGTGITSSGYPALYNISVYENAVISDVEGTQPYIGNTTVYGISGRAYGKQNNYFLIADTGAVFIVNSSTDYVPFVGNITYTTLFYFDKGDTRAAYVRQSGSTGMGSSHSHSSGSSTSNHSNNSCQICHGTGICQTCNGSGWVDNHYTGKRRPCTTCNNEKGNSPTRGQCWKCHGTGKK